MNDSFLLAADRSSITQKSRRFPRAVGRLRGCVAPTVWTRRRVPPGISAEGSFIVVGFSRYQ
jgi:hypothetical protein